MARTLAAALAILFFGPAHATGQQVVASGTVSFRFSGGGEFSYCGQGSYLTKDVTIEYVLKDDFSDGGTATITISPKSWSYPNGAACYDYPGLQLTVPLRREHYFLCQNPQSYTWRFAVSGWLPTPGLPHNISFALTDADCDSRVDTLQDPQLAVLYVTRTHYWHADRSIPLTSAPPPPAANVHIDRVRVAQAVWDPDIDSDDLFDMVLGKPAAVEVTLTLSGAEDTELNSTTVRLFAREVGSEWQEVDNVTYIATGNGTGTSYLTFTPGSGGVHELMVIADPIDGEVETTDNSTEQNPYRYDVKATRSLRIGYAPLRCRRQSCSDLTSDDFNESITRGSALIAATFPSASVDFRTLSAVPVDGALSEVTDLAALQLEAAIGGYDRVIGIAPTDYYSDSSITGGAYCGTYAGIARVDDHVAQAHELSHTFGIRCGINEEYKVLGPVPTDGYWVSPVPVWGNRDRLGTWSFMGSLPTGIHLAWIAKADYEQLFRRLVEDADDPEMFVLLLSIAEDGGARVVEAHYVQNGVPTPSVAGDYLIRTVSSTGAVLSETSFDVVFFRQSDPLGGVPVAAVPVVMAIPYSTAVEQIEVVHKGQQILSVDPTQILLRHAIKGAPDEAFRDRRLAQHRRKTLLTLAQVFEWLLKTKKPWMAHQFLLSTIRPLVHLWFNGSYVENRPSEVTKYELLMVIDRLAARLHGLSHRPGGVIWGHVR